MGTGTGILAVLASKLGAKSIVGVDFDEWAYNNPNSHGKIAIPKIESLNIDFKPISTFCIARR